MSPTYYQDREAKARAALQPAAIFAAVSAAISAMLLGNNVPGDAIHAFTLGICMVAVFVFLWWRYTLLPTELGRGTLKEFDAEIQLIIHGDPEMPQKLSRMSDNDLVNRILRLDWMRRWIPPINAPAIEVDIALVRTEQIRRRETAAADHLAAEAVSRPTLFSTLSRLSRDIPPLGETEHHTPGNSALMDACRETDELLQAVARRPHSRGCGVKVEEISPAGFTQALEDHVRVIGCEADVLALRREDLPTLRNFSRDELPAVAVGFPGCTFMNLECEYALPDDPTHVYARANGSDLILSFPRALPEQPVEQRSERMQNDLRMIAGVMGVAVPEPTPPPRSEPEEPRLRRFDF